MELHYILIVFIFFSYFCENRLVTGISVLNVTETTATKSKLLVQTGTFVTPKPVDANTTSVKTTDTDSVTEKNSSLCANATCPRTYCENNLPPIPSQGICCQRCVTNSTCNASTCPKYKCVTDVIPANLTAGECCDRCPPARLISAKPKITTSQRKKTRPSSKEENNNNEQIDGKNDGCIINSFRRKQYKNDLRLVRLLIETLSYLTHPHSDDGDDNSSESSSSSEDN